LKAVKGAIKHTGGTCKKMGSKLLLQANVLTTIQYFINILKLKK